MMKGLPVDCLTSADDCTIPRKDDDDDRTVGKRKAAKRAILDLRELNMNLWSTASKTNIAHLWHVVTLVWLIVSVPTVLQYFSSIRHLEREKQNNLLL